jgi:16S rRNA (guanine966-N2)-methyltransferase
MIVSSGKWQGRRLIEPKNLKTHPMGLRPKQALLNMLGELRGLEVLELFAGSGALGIEALSQEAKSVTFVESNTQACQAIRSNVALLGCQNCVLHTVRCQEFSERHASRFDLVFCCPPYDDLQESYIQTASNHTKQGGLFVLDWPNDVTLPVIAHSELLRHRTYARAGIAIYRRIS